MYSKTCCCLSKEGRTALYVPDSVSLVAAECQVRPYQKPFSSILCGVKQQVPCLDAFAHDAASSVADSLKDMLF